jgi:tellurite resistance protein TerC
VLAFVSLKMLLAEWIEVPVTISLAVILFVLAVFAVASKLVSTKKSADV